MKNNYNRLFACLLTGCIAFSACGAPDSRETPAANTEAQDDTPETQQEDASGTQQEDTAQNTDPEQIPAPQTDSASDTPAGSSAFNTTFPSASIDSLLPAPFTETETEEPAGIEDNEVHNIVGIITDATHYSVSIQTPDGNFYYMTIPETGVTGNLDYITIGQLATLSYTGSLDENHASLVGISNSQMVTGIYLEEYAFAIKIINAARAMDLKALSDLTNFPVFLETGTFSSSIDTSGEFEAIDTEKIFTEALVTRLANYNLFDLKYTDAGFVMGNGTPSLTFDVDDDGILGIIGINCNPAPDSTDGN